MHDKPGPFLPPPSAGPLLQGPPKPSTQPGSRQRISLARLLYGLGESSFTGALRVVANDRRHEMFLREGRVAHVRLPTFELPLGHILCDLGLLDRPTYARSLVRTAEERTRHGAVLRSMGVITDQQLAWALTIQVLRRAEAIFRIRDGRYGVDGFDHEFGRDHDLGSLGVDVLRVIYFGVCRGYFEDDLRGEMKALESTSFRMRTTGRAQRDQLERYGFSEEAWPILMALGRGEYWTLSEVLALASHSRREDSGELMRPIDTLRVVYTLFATDLLERARR